MDIKKIRDFKLSEVAVSDPYIANALQKEIEYLNAFDEDRMLAGFYEVKGLKPKAIKYPGWESTEIRGHSMGHHLTALAQAYAQTGNQQIKEKIDYIIAGFKECQCDDGYLSAFPAVYFDDIENKKPRWVPWYTMDKILAGLNSVYEHLNNEDALLIASKLGDWIYNRVSKWSEETQNTVLAIEYGGMNEALYDLYRHTKKEEHKEAAHKFDEMPLFEHIHNNEDILNGKHANTTIPKILGALYRYIASDYSENEKFYLETAETFFDMVLLHHSYVTGGNSEWEHFGEPYVLDAERTNCNCETCNTYNMLKLARELFKITGNKKYSDFYENTFVNAILSSQNPKTGMSMYFQPMATGFFKVYSTPFDSFWCCTGTGMENFTKCNDSIYFYDDTTVYINQFVSSRINTDDFALVAKADLPEGDAVTFEITKGCKTLALRVPDWTKDEKLFINGKSCEIKPVNGYIYVENATVDMVILYVLPMRVVVSKLPDNNHSVAFKYGPVVLSACLGKEDMVESKTGVDVTIPSDNHNIKGFITVNDGDVDGFLNNIDKNLVKEKDKVAFKLKNTDSDDIIFTPHYSKYDERYGIYYTFVSEDSKELQDYIKARKTALRLENVAEDSIPLGNDQYELLHNIKGESTGGGTFNGKQLRHAWGKDGWFSYDMKVNPNENNYLLCEYFGPNAGRTFNIYINDELLKEETIEDKNNGDFYFERYLIPEKYIGAGKINVKFTVRGDSFVGGIFDRMYIVRDFSKECGIKELLIKGGKLDKDFNTDVFEYELTKTLDDTTFLVKSAAKCGLVYYNDILTDDSLERKISFKSGDEFVIKTFADDFETFKSYRFRVK